MKRGFALLLASLMLVFTLTACGRKDNQQNTQDNGGTQSDSAVIGGESGNGSNGGNQGGNGSSDHQDSSGGNSQSPIEEGVDGAMDNITGTNGASDGGVSYDQMLNNGQVDHSTLAEDGTAQR